VSVTCGGRRCRGLAALPGGGLGSSGSFCRGTGSSIARHGLRCFGVGDRDAQQRQRAQSAYCYSPHSLQASNHATSRKPPFNAKARPDAGIVIISDRRVQRQFRPGGLQVTEVYLPGRWFHPAASILFAGPGKLHPDRSSGSTRPGRIHLRRSPAAC
jgi:hypothetical protein